LRLAALRSTTEATKLYAQAVSFVAKSMSINSDAPVFYQRERGELNNCIATLMFLARKQRAHSGFDLNQSCLAITRVHREAYSQQMSVNPTEQEEKQLAILDRRIRTLQELGNAVDGEKSELFVDFLKDLRWRNCNDNKETIWALRNLWRDTVLQIDLDRDELA